MLDLSAHTRRTRGRVAAIAVAVAVSAASAVAFAQVDADPPPSPPPSLKKWMTDTGFKPVPDAALAYVANKSAAVALGKALFWDQAIGSDGIACASCHFSAGADARIKNQISPGLKAGDTTFNPTRSGSPKSGANYTIKKEDFPFHVPADNEDGDPAFDTNDVMSSAGVFRANFFGLPTFPRDPRDVCKEVEDPVFSVNHTNTRRVEPRNTPTTYNAVFNRRNFFDGRANNVFNGRDPFGPRNTTARIAVKDGGGWHADPVAIKNFSLASQAVGPIFSPLEMICQDAGGDGGTGGRSAADFGKKMLPKRPLAEQQVSPSDSVLAAYRLSGTLGMGLKGTYRDMVAAAFKPEYWKGGVVPAGMPNAGYDQMEANFTLFWGIAVAMYESTLISDDTPYDRFADGDTSALSPLAQQGMRLFFSDKAKCANCHGGPQFSNATFGHEMRNKTEGMVMGDGGRAWYDDGFYNIGVRPSAEDIGVGDVDPFGNPLSFSVQHVFGPKVDEFDVGGSAAQRVAVKGAFKVPGLRNIELTGPYFHNGGQLTLGQVVEFYDRGGDFRQENMADLDPDIQRINFEGLAEFPQAEDALVEFLKALTDKRVRCEMAPYDHPGLKVPHGIEGNEVALQDLNNNGKYDEQILIVPAVGKDGLPSIRRPCLESFARKLGAEDNGKY